MKNQKNIQRIHEGAKLVNRRSADAGRIIALATFLILFLGAIVYNVSAHGL